MIEHRSNLLVAQMCKSRHNSIIDITPNPYWALHPKQHHIDEVRPPLWGFDQFRSMGCQRWESPHPSLSTLAVAKHAVLLVYLRPSLGQCKTKHHHKPG